MTGLKRINSSLHTSRNIYAKWYGFNRKDLYAVLNECSVAWQIGNMDSSSNSVSGRTDSDIRIFCTSGRTQGYWKSYQPTKEIWQDFHKTVRPRQLQSVVYEIWIEIVQSKITSVLLVVQWLHNKSIEYQNNKNVKKTVIGIMGIIGIIGIKNNRNLMEIRIQYFFDGSGHFIQRLWLV